MSSVPIIVSIGHHCSNIFLDVFMDSKLESTNGQHIFFVFFVKRTEVKILKIANEGAGVAVNYNYKLGFKT